MTNGFPEAPPLRPRQWSQWDGIDQHGLRLPLCPPGAADLPCDYERVAEIHGLAGTGRHTRGALRHGFAVSIGDKVLVVDWEEMDRSIACGTT